MSEPAAPPTQASAVSARRTAGLAFTFAGRARRSEVVNYALSAAFILLAVSFATALFADFALRHLVSTGLTILLALPVPALLVRRLHDQGRAGTLAWLATIGFAVWLVRTGIALTQGTEARIGLDRLTWAIDWLVILANLATVILALLPGTPGPNRYGPDPRAAADAAASG